MSRKAIVWGTRARTMVFVAKLPSGGLPSEWEAPSGGRIIPADLARTSHDLSAFESDAIVLDAVRWILGINGGAPSWSISPPSLGHDSRSQGKPGCSCTLTPSSDLAGRVALVELITSGSTLKAAAAAFNVTPATAHRWWHRFDSAALSDKASGCWAVDRSSRPHRSPRRLGAEREAKICAVRQATGWGPRLVAGATGHPHATVWRVLRRHGLSRIGPAQRGAPNRYEWPCPGDMLHMDVCSYARFERPGHRVTGDRSQRNRSWMNPETRVGYDYAHAIIDDHSRLAYVELHDDERAATVTGFVERALAFFDAHGITTQRVLTDNAFTYVKNRSLRELFATRGIGHRTTRPYRPRTNGKVERLHQTMGREWAYGRSYRSSSERASRLRDWLEHYNHRRPHSAIGDRAPITRVHNLPKHTLESVLPARRDGPTRCSLDERDDLAPRLGEPIEGHVDFVGIGRVRRDKGTARRRPVGGKPEDQVVRLTEHPLMDAHLDCGHRVPWDEPTRASFCKPAGINHHRGLTAHSPIGSEHRRETEHRHGDNDSADTPGRDRATEANDHQEAEEDRGSSRPATVRHYKRRGCRFIRGNGLPAQRLHQDNYRRQGRIAERPSSGDHSVPYAARHA